VAGFFWAPDPEAEEDFDVGRLGLLPGIRINFFSRGNWVVRISCNPVPS
jgi:hypothetical protein